MIVMTLTLKDTAHQQVLHFKDAGSAKAACDKIGGFLEKQTVTVADDFGKIAAFAQGSLIATLISDLELEMDRRAIESTIKLRAENQYAMKLQQDPELRFLVDQSPNFRRP